MQIKLYISVHAAQRIFERFGIMLVSGSYYELTATRIQTSRHFEAGVTIDGSKMTLILDPRPNNAFVIITALHPTMVVKAIAA